MRILMWHVHGAWADAFVRGRHEYLLPTTAEGGPWGLGRAGRDWPENAREIDPGALAETDVDLVVLQRPEEVDVAERLLGRRLGRDAPAVYVEHNTPRQDVPNSRHPLAGRTDILIVHVTHFNELMWDCADSPTTVIEHGMPDPGPLYSGETASLGVVVNEPIRRWRVTGTDLLPRFASVAPLTVFGMKTDGLPDELGLPTDRVVVRGDLPPDRLHAELAHCRVYLHPLRWTSLGLALIEAMHLGMPVVALATTEAIRAVPPEAGAISTDPAELVQAARHLIEDPAEATSRGAVAREVAVARYGLGKFLEHWDAVIDDWTSRHPAHRAPVLSTHPTEG